MKPLPRRRRLAGGVGGLVLFAVFWNAITLAVLGPVLAGLFGLIDDDGHARAEAAKIGGPIGFALFSLPFLAIGLGALAFAGLALFARLGLFPKVEASSQEVRRGDRLAISILPGPHAEWASGFVWRLRCRREERLRLRRHGKARLVVTLLHDQLLARAEGPDRARLWEGWVEIPRDAWPSAPQGRQRLFWVIEVEGWIGPVSFTDQYVITVT